MILVARAPATVWKVSRSNAGVIRNLEKKREFVNHYSFHIMDPTWGHLTIKMSGHPPFGAQVILNGHEYVACQAHAAGIRFAKEGNCFTRIDDPERVAQVADTLSQPGTIGRLSVPRPERTSTSTPPGRPPTTCANCAANNSSSNPTGAAATTSPATPPARSPRYSPSASTSSHQSSPASADQDPDGRPRPTPASTATTTTSAPACAPSSPTSPSTPPHRQQIVDHASQAPSALFATINSPRWPPGLWI